jgi:uncharacterized protein YkwD
MGNGRHEVSAGQTALRAAFSFAIGFCAVVWLATAPLEALAGPESELMERVNAIRAEHKLIALAPSQDLARVARAHAEDMARRSYLSHVNPEGQNPLTRAQAAGLSGFRLLAENIGASSIAGDRVASIVSEWMRSRDHRENVLNPAFNTSGLAVVESASGQTIIVQLYATYPHDTP